jgi:hypothetical protein
MQAIRTKYHGPGNVRGSRFSAQCDAGRIYVPYDYALGVEENHKAACEALCVKLGWVAPRYQPMVGGCFDNDYYWVFQEQL